MSRGDAHTIVNTVTDDPERAVRRHRRAGARGHDRHLGAASGRNAGVDERVPNELRSAAPERPEPFGRVGDPHGGLGTDPVGVDDREPFARPATPPEAPSSIHVSTTTRPKRTRPGSASRTGIRRGSRNGRGASTQMEPRADPLDPPAPGQLDRPPFAARDLEHGVDRRQRGRRTAEPAAGPRGAPTRATSARSAAASSGSCSAASASSSSLSSRRTSAWRASTSTRSRAAPRSSRGITSRRSQTRRWCSSSFIGSLHRGAAEPGADLVRVGAPQAEQRPAQRARAATAMPARPGGSAPPQQRQQHRLGLIVTGVPDEQRHGAAASADPARAPRSARRAPGLRDWRGSRTQPRSPAASAPS